MSAKANHAWNVLLSPGTSPAQVLQMVTDFVQGGAFQPAKAASGDV
jgi:hypothetical protein